MSPHNCLRRRTKFVPVFAHANPFGKSGPNYSVVSVFIDDIIERQIEEGIITPELREKITFVLLRKHRHQTKKPIHRSLADIGKSSSSTCEFCCYCLTEK